MTKAKKDSTNALTKSGLLKAGTPFAFVLDTNENAIKHATTDVRGKVIRNVVPMVGRWDCELTLGILH